jgi:hypothetical protein
MAAPITCWEAPTSVGANKMTPNPIEEEPTYLLGDTISLPLLVIRPIYVVNK